MSSETYPYCPLDDRAETRCSSCSRVQPWFEDWVTHSREAQDLPAKITDPASLHKIAVLLGAR